MKTLISLSFVFFVAFLLIGPSCSIFEFREACKDNKVEFRDSIIQAGSTAWKEEQRGEFYCGVVEGKMMFYWNAGVYFEVCVANSIIAHVQAEVRTNMEVKPTVEIVVTTSATLDKEEIRIAGAGPAIFDSYNYEESIALDFNRVDDEMLYGSVNVQTRVHMPITADMNIEDPQSLAWYTFFLETLVKEIRVQIEYID